MVLLLRCGPSEKYADFLYIYRSMTLRHHLGAKIHVQSTALSNELKGNYAN